MSDLSIIKILFIAIFSLAVAKQVLYWSWLWQLKEYRADRMRAHFQDIGLKNLFLAFIGYSSLRQNKKPESTVKSAFVIFTSFLLAASVYFYILWRFSPIRVYDALISANSSAAGLSIIRDGIYWNYETIIVASAITFFLIPLLVFLPVLIFNRIAEFFKKRIIKKAKAKIGKLPNLIVIGITGSYGKSTTKEILAEILSKRFRVLKTPANINTPIGIAKLILNELKAEHQVFIVEMGAYKKGEIREICDIVKPKMGIITAINEQHLALFGSIQNTIEAKFELVDSLPAEGLAILNIGDENIQKGFDARNTSEKKIAAEVKLYSVGEKSDFYAINVSASGRYVKFKLVFGQEMQDFTLNVIGAHNISNALAAIIAAKKMGIEFSETAQTLQRISRLPGIFKTSIGSGSSTFIEDTYNANPDGVLAALDYLKNLRGRKIVVMSSLIELGASACKIHESLGKEISAIANRLILTDDYYFADIKAGAEKNKGSIVEIELGKNAQKVAKRLMQDLKASDTALFINRGAGKVLELLKKK